MSYHGALCLAASHFTAEPASEGVLHILQVHVSLHCICMGQYGGGARTNNVAEKVATPVGCQPEGIGDDEECGIDPCQQKLHKQQRRQLCPARLPAQTAAPACCTMRQCFTDCDSLMLQGQATS